MSAVTDILLAPDVRPFAISAAIMVTLGGIELLTTLVGFSLSESSARTSRSKPKSHSAIGGLFLWINAGRLPLLILMILALGVFAIAGFLLQGIAHSIGTGRAGHACGACRRSAQPAGDPPEQPRYRPHHPARRDLRGE